MGKINVSRVFLGGLVASLILFILASALNGALLEPQWLTWVKQQGSQYQMVPQSTSIMLWLAYSLINGIAGVWIYAGIRPRLGAGPKTALVAGLVIWLVSFVTSYIGHIALRDIPGNLACANCLAGLVMAPLAILAGAAIYKE